MRVIANCLCLLHTQTLAMKDNLNCVYTYSYNIKIIHYHRETKTEQLPIKVLRRKKGAENVDFNSIRQLKQPKTEFNETELII